MEVPENEPLYSDAVLCHYSASVCLVNQIAPCLVGVLKPPDLFFTPDSETLIVIVCMHMKTVEKFSFSAFCADTYNLHGKQQSTTKKSSNQTYFQKKL
jgi:hypothetical protein